MSEIITGVERTIFRGRGQTPATVDDYCWRCRQRAAYKKLAVTSILYFVLLFASNLFYPLEPLPKWFRAAALANPITCQIDCLRWATIGGQRATGRDGVNRIHRVQLPVTGVYMFCFPVKCYAPGFPQLIVQGVPY